MAKLTDLQLLEVVIENPGATDEEIGGLVGLSRVQIARRRNSESFKILFSLQLSQVFEPLLAAQVLAVRVLCRTLQSKNERVALKACELVLAHAKESKAGDKDQASTRILNRLREVVASRNRVKEPTISPE